MSPGLLSALIGLVLVLAVGLLAGGAWIWWRDSIRPKRLESERLKQIAAPLRIGQEQVLQREVKVAEGRFGAYLLSLERRIYRAGWSMRAEVFLAAMAAGFVGVAVGVPVLFGFADRLGSPSVLLITVVAAFGAAVVLPFAMLDRRCAKRLQLLEQQFPLALDIFIRGLRAGHPVSRSLDLLIREMSDPIAGEFKQVVAEVSYGWDLRQALEALADRVETQDIRMFVVSMAIQSETGGSLSEVLEGLTRVIRERASMKLKVRALASEGKMTASVLSLIPVLTFVAVFVINPDFYLRVADDSWFLPGALGLLGLYSMGVMIIRRLIDLKV